MGVVVGREVGFILVVARVALVAEGAVEGGHGFAGGGGLRRRESLMAGRHVCVVGFFVVGWDCWWAKGGCLWRMVLVVLHLSVSGQAW